MVSCGFGVFHSLLFIVYIVLCNTWMFSQDYIISYYFHKDVLSILGAPDCFVLSALNLWWARDEVTGAGRDKCEAVFECFFQDNQRCQHHSCIFLYFVHICCWCWMVHICSCYVHATSKSFCLGSQRLDFAPWGEGTGLGRWTRLGLLQGAHRHNTCGCFFWFHFLEAKRPEVIWQSWFFKGTIFWGQRLVASL